MKHMFLYVLMLSAVAFPFHVNAQRLLEPIQGIEGRIPVNAHIYSSRAEWTQGEYGITFHFKGGIVDEISIYPSDPTKPGIKPDWNLIRQLCPSDLNWENPNEKNEGPNSPSSAFGHYHFKWNYLNFKVALTVNYLLAKTPYKEPGDLQSVSIWRIKNGSF